MSLFGGRETLVDLRNVAGSNTLLGVIEMGITSSRVSSQSVR